MAETRDRRGFLIYLVFVIDELRLFFLPELCEPAAILERANNVSAEVRMAFRS